MPAPRWLSQLRVKLGTTRPPISAISTNTAPKPSRRPNSPVAEPSVPACDNAQPTAKHVSSARTGRLRQLRPITISRRARPTKAKQKPTSTAAGSPRAGRGTNEIEATRRGPEKHQTKQRQTADRRPASPVRYRGQQETGEYGARVAEQQLMLMPGERIEREWEAQHTSEHPQPQSQGQRSPERGPEKERAETLPKDGDTRQRRGGDDAHRSIVHVWGGPCLDDGQAGRIQPRARRRVAAAAIRVDNLGVG